MNVEEEREPRRESIDVQPARHPAFDVREPVRERERKLLRRRRAGFADVIAGDRDRIPLRRVLRAPLEQVHDQAQRGLDRITPRVLRHVLLEDVVLHGAAKQLARHSLLLGRRHVEAEQDHRRPVDGHRRGDLVERDPLEQRLHVVQARDRDPGLADFALGPRVIRVVAHQRREVERRREPGLSLLEQELEPLVRVAGAPKAGELPHGPESPAIPGRVDAPRVRVLARHRQGGCVQVLHIQRRVHRVDFALGVHERQITLLGFRITSAPAFHFRAKAFQLLLPLALLFADLFR